MNQPLIEFQNAAYAYPAEEGVEPLPAVRNLSFAIGRGEFVAMVGHNGSGKSTVAKLCNGLIAPQEGVVLVEGLDTCLEENLFEVRRRVGMVFQNPDNQIIAAVVEDDVAFGPENLCVPPDEMRARVDEALKAVGMYDLRLSEPHKLSGGQKQRVAIAGVLAMRPRCVVLDEPTAMLDPIGRREVLETIGRLRATWGMTVVLITHHMDECIGADRVIVLSEGEVALDGGPEDVFSRVERLRELGLDAPDTTALLWELNARGFHFPLDALTIEACAQVIAL